MLVAPYPCSVSAFHSCTRPIYSACHNPNFKKFTIHAICFLSTSETVPYGRQEAVKNGYDLLLFCLNITYRCINRTSFAHLLSVGHVHAVQHVSAPDREDCALAFYEAMFAAHAADLERCGRGELPETWLHRCAAHFAQNYRRHLDYVQSHECTWPVVADEEGRSMEWEPLAALPSSDAPLCREELNRRIADSLTCLNPHQRRYLLLHYAHGLTYARIAAEHDDHEDAVRMTVNRARRHLRAVLFQSGFDAVEACDYLSELSACNAERERAEVPC